MRCASGFGTVTVGLGRRVFLWFLLAVVFLGGRGSADSGVRPVACAGVYYPEDPALLAASVDAHLSGAPGVQLSGRVRALVVPHSVYSRSGAAAGAAFALVPEDTEQVVVVTSWHPRFEHLPEDIAGMRGLGSIPDKRAYATPLGEVPVCFQAGALRGAHGCFSTVAAAHFWEPGIEVQLPFLQRRLGAFSLLPIVVDAGADAVAIAAALEPLFAEASTLLVVSAESSHEPGVAVGESDSSWAEAISAMDSHAVLASHFCGVVPVSVLLLLAQRLGWEPLPLSLPSAADSGGVCIAFVQSAEGAIDSGSVPSQPVHQGLEVVSLGERAILLDLARRSIMHRLAGKELPALPLYSATFNSRLGCFVSLESGAGPRGSIGSLGADDPLVASVQKNALRAAFQDTRFGPVTAGEMADITIEIRVLTEPEPLTCSDAEDLLRQLLPGEHGVIITQGEKRATFLPHVWRQLPDKASFLGRLCQQAGLPADAWRDPAAVQVQVYEVCRFRETSQE